MTSNGHDQRSGAPEIRIRHETRYRPVAAGTFHILTCVSAPRIVRRASERPPLDLAFVIDRSGSMANGALDLARRGAEHAFRLLGPDDSVSLVVYDDRIDTLLSQRRFDADARAKATRRLGRIGPRGSTDLAGGWLTGCDQLAPIADGSRVIRANGARSIVRALLLTDGLANVGMVDPHEIALHAGELAARGISTSTFGVGAQYDEELLALMAASGQGHYHHIADADAIPRVFAGELGEMLEVVMRDATLALKLPDGWQAALLNDLPIERRDGWISLRLGELSSSETRTLLWEVELPESVDGQQEEITIRLTWNDAHGAGSHDETRRHPIEANHRTGQPDREVQDELARLIGARARAEAIRYNKLGRYDLASQAVRLAAAAMPATPEGRAAAQELLDEVEPGVAFMADPAFLKQQYARSRNVQRSRRDYST